MISRTARRPMCFCREDVKRIHTSCQIWLQGPIPGTSCAVELRPLCSHPCNSLQVATPCRSASNLTIPQKLTVRYSCYRRSCFLLHEQSKSATSNATEAGRDNSPTVQASAWLKSTLDILHVKTHGTYMQNILRKRAHTHTYTH